MFGLAAAAACMPDHEDSLNDLSLMPPVSVTIQPVNLAGLPAPVPFDDELGLAHPAASKATAASAAAARKVCLTCYLLVQSACRPLRPDGVPTASCGLRAPSSARSAHGLKIPGACFGMIAG